MVWLHGTLVRVRAGVGRASPRKFVLESLLAMMAAVATTISNNNTSALMDK